MDKSLKRGRQTDLGKRYTVSQKQNIIKYIIGCLILSYIFSPFNHRKKVNRGKRWVCLYFRSGYKIWRKVYFPGKLIKMELSVKILPCIRNYAKCFMDVFWFKVVIIILILQLTVMKRFIRLLVKLKPRCFFNSMVPPNHE